MPTPRLLLFSARSYDRTSFVADDVRVQFQEATLNVDTAVLADGFPAVCAFVGDTLDAPVLERLWAQGVKLLALRCAGTNHVDLQAARRLGLAVVRVPAYSPHAVAEHAVALALSLNRKIHRAFARTREFNFSLEGLVGFDMHGKTVGIVGTGKIGRIAAQIFAGFGCQLRFFDLKPQEALAERLGGKYVPLQQLYRESDVISLHLPLTPQTHHMVNDEALKQMRRQVMLLNTSRGALIDSRALMEALKAGRIGSAGLDVYEEEEGLYFTDHSGDVVQDDLLARLLTFPNVLISAHQGFLTDEALEKIAQTTLDNVRSHAAGRPLQHQP